MRPTGPLLLILAALAAVIWGTSPASGDEGRAADGLTVEVSTAR